MPNYCIIRDCAHHSPNKQQTFGSAYEIAEHWNKYHREVLDCFLKADPVFLTFLRLIKCRVDDCNHVCFGEEYDVSHYHEVHSMCGSVSSPEATEMVDEDATEDEGGMATEDVDVQLDDIEPMFKSAMEICLSQHKRELELDLWNNSPYGSQTPPSHPLQKGAVCCHAPKESESGLRRGTHPAMHHRRGAQDN